MKKILIILIVLVGCTFAQPKDPNATILDSLGVFSDTLYAHKIRFEDIEDTTAQHRAELLLKLSKSEYSDSIDWLEVRHWKDSVNGRISDSLVSRDAEIIAIDTKTRNISDSLAEAYSLTKLDSIRIDNAEAKAVTDSARISAIEDSTTAQRSDLEALMDSVIAHKGLIDNIEIVSTSLPGAITIVSPQAGEEFHFFRAPYDLEISRVSGYLVGGGGDDSISVNLRIGAVFGSELSELFSANKWLTTTTKSFASFYDATISEDEYFWLYIGTIVQDSENRPTALTIDITYKAQ